jgi:hypothetical protein
MFVFRGLVSFLRNKIWFCERYWNSLLAEIKCSLCFGTFGLKVSFMGSRHFKMTALKDINKICNQDIDSVEITNKLQPCDRIYYSTVHWQLNMFLAAYRSSSGALTVFAASGLHTHVVTGRSQVSVPTQTWLRPVTTCVCKPEAANTVRAPDDERRTTRNMLSL